MDYENVVLLLSCFSCLDHIEEMIEILENNPDMYVSANVSDDSENVEVSTYNYCSFLHTVMIRISALGAY